jgi:hypothetical protein
VSPSSAHALWLLEGMKCRPAAAFGGRRQNDARPSHVEPNRIWIYDLTDPCALGAPFFAIDGVRSRKWIATPLTPDQSSTQVAAIVTDAPTKEGR